MTPGAISISLSSAVTSKVRSVRPSGSVETVPVSQSVSIAVGIEAVARVVDLADRDHRPMRGVMVRIRGRCRPARVGRMAGMAGLRQASPLAQITLPPAADKPAPQQAAPADFLAQPGAKLGHCSHLSANENDLQYDTGGRPFAIGLESLGRTARAGLAALPQADPAPARRLRPARKPVRAFRVQSLADQCRAARNQSAFTPGLSVSTSPVSAAFTGVRRRSMSEGPMAPRANWKGFLKVGEVTCPVALYTAASTSDRIAFHTINRATGQSRPPAVCRQRDRQAGREGGPGQGLRDRLRRICGARAGRSGRRGPGERQDACGRRPSSRCDDIDDVYFDKPYYLAPSDKHAEEAFALIRDGHARQKVAALAQTVLFRRVRTLLIRAA